MPKLTGPILSRIFIIPSGCWIWTAALDAAGYGVVRFEDGARRAHRVSYELFKGAIPRGAVLDHLCRTPACVNPDHLEAVTNGVNNRRGRHTKLTPEDVRAIRASTGEHLPDLAKKYGVTHQHIKSLRLTKRRSWHDVD